MRPDPHVFERLGVPRIGRVFYQGRIVPAVPYDETHIRLMDGTIVCEEEVSFLPPFEPGTIIALGLNYADHASELSFKPPSEPIIFFKGKNALSGHRAIVMRPPAEMVHYEGELAVVIGRSGYHILEKDAMAHVLGYTVANDFAVRDMLENYYRPNLPVKNRDGMTPIGPWLTAASMISDPLKLTIETTVNGQTVQKGSTGDMIFGISEIIALISRVLTLRAGDVILTGTPKGAINVGHGDRVRVHIEGVGTLDNTICEEGRTCHTSL